MRASACPSATCSVGAGAAVAAAVASGLVATAVGARAGRRGAPAASRRSAPCSAAATRAGAPSRVRGALIGARAVPARAAPRRAASGSAAAAPAALSAAVLGIAHDDGDVRRHGARRAVPDHAAASRLLAVPLRRLSPTGGRLAADARARQPARAPRRPPPRSRSACRCSSSTASMSRQLPRHDPRPDRPQASRATSPSRPIGGGARDRRQLQVAPRRCARAIARAARGAASSRRVRARFVEPARDAHGQPTGSAIGVDPARLRQRRPQPATGGATRERGAAGRRRAAASSWPRPTPARRACTSATAHAARARRRPSRAPVVGELTTSTDFGGNGDAVSLRTMARVYGVDDRRPAARHGPVGRPRRTPLERRRSTRIVAPRLPGPRARCRPPSSRPRSTSQINQQFDAVQRDRRDRGDRQPARRRQHARDVGDRAHARDRRAARARLLALAGALEPWSTRAC